MKIEKISDYIFVNTKNIGIIFKYYGNFLFNQEDVQKIIDLLDRYDSQNSTYNIKINVGILKHNGRKQYFIELYSGLEGYYNNPYPVTLKAKDYYRSVFQSKIDDFKKAFGNKVELLKNFYLFDDNKVTQLFNTKQEYDTFDIEKPSDSQHPKKSQELLGGLSNYLKAITGGDKEKIDLLVNTDLNNILGFNSRITLDSFDGEAIGIGNPSVGDYNLFSAQIFAKNQAFSERSEGQKIRRTYGKVSLEKLLSLLDQKDRNGNELFPKYYLKFTIANASDKHLETYGDGTLSFKNNQRYRFAKDNVDFFFDVGINTFLFTKKTSLVNFYEQLNQEGFVVHNYNEALGNDQVILQDPFYEAKSFTDKEGIEGIFNIMKAYRNDEDGIKWGKEIISNNDIKYYPHKVAGMSDGALEGAIHTAILGDTGSGKTHTASYLFSQFGEDNTQALMIDNLSFEEKLYNFVGGNGDYVKNPENGEIKYVGDGRGTYKLVLEDLDETDNYYFYNPQKKEYYKDNGTSPKGNYVKKGDEFKKVGRFEFVGGNGRYIVDNKKPIFLGDGKGTYEPKIDYARISIGEDPVNLIGKLRNGEKEIDNKTDFLCNILGVHDLNKENPNYDPLVTKIKNYLTQLSNDPEDPIFQYNDFKKEMNDWIKSLSDIKKNSSQESMIKHVIEVPNTYKEVLNSKVDFFEVIKNKPKIIFQLKNINNDKKKVSGFFKLLAAYFEYNMDTIKYCFVDEVTNYYKPGSPDIEIQKLTDIFSHFLRESRNQNTAILPITQKSLDIKGLHTSIKQFIKAKDKDLAQIDSLINLLGINLDGQEKENLKVKKYRKLYKKLINSKEHNFINFMRNKLDKSSEEKEKNPGSEIYLTKVPGEFGVIKGF